MNTRNESPHVALMTGLGLLLIISLVLIFAMLAFSADDRPPIVRSPMSNTGAVISATPR